MPDIFYRNCGSRIDFSLRSPVANGRTALQPTKTFRRYSILLFPPFSTDLSEGIS